MLHFKNYCLIARFLAFSVALILPLPVDYFQDFQVSPLNPTCPALKALYNWIIFGSKNQCLSSVLFLLQYYDENIKFIIYALGEEIPEEHLCDTTSAGNSKQKKRA